MTTKHGFTAITSEGGLLPTDFLADLADPKAKIDGVDPVTYGLVPGERLGEQVNRSWNRLKGCWTNFQRSIVAKQPGDPTTTETRERWLLPLFQELDFGRLTAAKAVEIDGKSYPVSHGWESVPIHLVGSHVDLDRRTPGAVGAARMSPHSLVQQVLNASDDRMWGIISNGFTLRLLRDNVTLTRIAYIEWDLQAIFDGDLYPEFFLLWLVCHQSRFEVPPGARPEQCWLEKWKKQAEDKGLRALENLRPGVEKAIAELGAGFVSHKANQALRSKLSSGQLTTQDLYRQILRVIYRMLFLFVAEDRGLLHHPLPGDEAGKDAIDAALKARRRYRDFYSIGRLRDLTLHRAGTPHPDLGQVFQLVSSKLGSDTGCRELALPALGSFLWSQEATPDLNDCLLSNRHFLQAVHSLAYVRDGNVRRTIDYKNLGSEELGSVYESLLELHPIVNADTGTFELQTVAGHERKTSGSYYTPDSLVQCLLDSALEPVIAETIKGKEGPAAADALLKLKFCDPAVGSGHFLIAAGHRLAKRVAAARTGEEEPSPEAVRTALRDVIGHCLYGVDINPMAAELCRVSLWLEALEPGKPLSFLDHHIRVGNSLLGATPELIAQGIPDDAFKPIEGDDKKACSALKKRNAAERKGIGPLFAEQDKATQQILQHAAAALEELPDEKPEHIRQKADAFARAEANEQFLKKKLLADAWCSAFVILKSFKPGTNEPTGLTQGHLNDLAKGRQLPSELGLEVERLAASYRFFHWHLAFPEVFAHGGFDVTLGNPPWEKVELLQREWFAAMRPDLTTIPAGKEKEALLNELRISDPQLYDGFIEAVRAIDGERTFIQHSGRYPLCGQGRINSYAAFAETNLQILCPTGFVGCVLPPGIATDDSTKFFIQHLVENELLKCFFAFTNRGYIFPEIESTLSFALVTYGNKKTAILQLAAQLWQVEHLRDEGRAYSIDRRTIQRINPNTLNLPILQSSTDAELVSDIHRRIPVLQREDKQNELGWKIEFRQGLFNMTSDKKLFETLEQLQERGFKITGTAFSNGTTTSLPLYEAKLTSQFNHRHGTFEHVPTVERFGTRAQTNKPTIENLSNPDWCILPRYWVAERAVDQAIPEEWGNRWFLGFRNAISAVADSRSVAFVVIPRVAVGNSMPLLFCFAQPIESALLLANFNSFVLDYVGRQKACGGNLNFYVVKQLPILPASSYGQPCLWSGGSKTLQDWLWMRVLELSYTAWDLEAFAQDCGWNGPPFRWDEERRFLLRCELDAAFFHLYLPAGADGQWKPARVAEGAVRDETPQELAELKRHFPTPRDAVTYIMDTFPIVKRRDEQKHGEYRTKRVILEIYDEMTEAMRTGKPYRTRLDPPPADPSCCHPLK